GPQRPRGQLVDAGISADYRWKRTESEDEDGNISRSYTNALGQQVATASVIQGTTKSITLFNYDDQGNLALVIDPKKQHTTYKYNLSGVDVQQDHRGWWDHKIPVRC
ncbi:MAG: hypothetical protein IPO56_10790, partial [Flavobacteriales bacterium]|nr:hypothetical protein [Flavobacteriales bacterium]